MSSSQKILQNESGWRDTEDKWPSKGCHQCQPSGQRILDETRANYQTSQIWQIFGGHLDGQWRRERLSEQDEWFSLRQSLKDMRKQLPIAKKSVRRVPYDFRF